MDTQKIEEAVKALSEVDPAYDDFMEIVGVLVDDFKDMLVAGNKAQFMKQKRDAREVLKKVTRKFNNMTFKNK